MNFKSYYRLTKETTNNCFKICGVVFTGVYAVVAIISGYQNKSIVDAFALFALCFLLGNALGLLIWILAITTSFKQVRKTIKFYEAIPEKTREKYRLVYVAQPLNPKYNFLQWDIVNTGVDHIFNLKFDKNFVFITIYSDLTMIDNFQKRSLEIQRKYKTDNIVLTGWGLRKVLKSSEWRIITCDNIDTIIEQLLELSSSEGFRILRRVVNNNLD